MQFETLIFHLTSPPIAPPFISSFPLLSTIISFFPSIPHCCRNHLAPLDTHATLDHLLVEVDPAGDMPDNRGRLASAMPSCHICLAGAAPNSGNGGVGGDRNRGSREGWG